MSGRDIGRQILRYGFAVAAVAAGMLFRWWMERLTGPLGVPYVTLMPPVMLTALLAGPGPGIFATLLAALAADYWVLAPTGFGNLTTAEFVGLWIFVSVGALMCFVAGIYRKARDRAARFEKELVLRESAEEIRQQKDLLAVTLASIGDAVIVTDARGHVTFLNEEAERLTGWKQDEAAGKPLPAVFHIVNEATRLPVENPAEKVMRLGMVVGLANHTVLITKDGRETPIDDSGAPIKKPDGTLHGVVLVFRDFTERKQAEAVLERSMRRFELLARNAGRLLQVSNPRQLVEGICKDLMDMLDCHVFFNFLADGDSGRLHLNACAGITEEQARKIEWLDYGVAVCGCAARDGCRIIAEHIPTTEDPRTELVKSYGVKAYACHPLQGPGGKLIGTLSFGTRTRETFSEEDIAMMKAVTDQVATAMHRMADEQVVREGREDLKRAQSVAETGSWRLNVRKNELVWSDETYRIFGIPLGTPLTYELFLGAVHPADRDYVDNRWQAAMRGEPYDIEHRILVGDGDEVRWVRERAEMEFDNEGKLLGGFGTAQNITQMKKVQEALAAAQLSAEHAKAAAESASRAKDHFLAVLSHELRTPLTPVLATISMLQARGSAFDADTRESLEMVRRNVELEALLIDDLLDVTRITRGKVELQRKPVELCDVIGRAVEVCRGDIEARRLEFGVDIGSDGPYMLEADVARLQQVFWNLLKNAVKFTPHGGCVGIRCRRHDGYVVAEVNDSGIGIDPEALPRLFRPFEQGQREITQQFGGLGLGLAISKAMIELHGGTIDVRSEGKNKGASFIIRLPLLNAVPAAAPHVDGKAHITTASSPGSLRILMVEDHGDTAHIMRRLISAAGHQVTTAGDVETALELCAQRTFDLLLSDLGLPDGSGLDLMRSLRQRGLKLPGIALSGYGQEQDIQRSRDAGFSAHLTKPATPERLLALIAQIAKQ